MINKRGSIGNIILVIAFIILISVASYFFYSLYNDFYSSPQSLNVNYTQLENEPSYTSNLQTYPNIRFDHNNISFIIDASCSGRTERIKQAFSIIENKTRIISFYESAEDADISIVCSEESLEQEENTFIAGSGGAEGKVPFSGIYYILPKGNVTLYKEINCELPVVEIHEILHVLGFNHSSSEPSIMYPIASCNQAITNDIVNELKRLYSIPALPDLYFENISAIKKGSYLNLNFTVKNQGLKNSGNFTVKLYAENTKKDDLDFENIEPGAGRIFSIQNARISSSSNLKIVISNGEELDENNNIAELSLS